MSAFASGPNMSTPLADVQMVARFDDQTLLRGVDLARYPVELIVGELVRCGITFKFSCLDGVWNLNLYGMNSFVIGHRGEVDNSLPHRGVFLEPQEFARLQNAVHIYGLAR